MKKVFVQLTWKELNKQGKEGKQTFKGKLVVACPYFFKTNEKSFSLTNVYPVCTMTIFLPLGLKPVRGS